MTDREIEQKLAQALEKTAPKDIQGVLSRCEERKGTVVFMKDVYKRQMWAEGEVGKQKGRFYGAERD